MAPVELEYSLNGHPKDKVVAEDGKMATLGTPAGPVFAKVEKQGKSWLTRRPLADRIGTRFPSDPEHIPLVTRTDGLNYRINSIFDPLFPSIRRILNKKELTRVREYVTSQGNVVIKVTGSDQE